MKKKGRPPINREPRIRRYITLDPQLDARVRQVARARGMSVSELINRALARLIAD